ncbi:MAG: hypothetical protein IPK33_13320 [Gemmatimonadetes bacterium]|nr:hypothetical protein [Gemmatimonadota bacterium]
MRLTASSGPAPELATRCLLDPWNTPHNKTIIWDDLLRQTSDWEDAVGEAGWADRPAQNSAEWKSRPRKAPGTAYEYNDVRVNVLALAATNIWRRPAPQCCATT